MDKNLYDKLTLPFEKKDFEGEKLRSESIFKRFDDVFMPWNWGISYSDLDECYGCTITVDGIAKTGIGETIALAITDCAMQWGMKITLPAGSPAQPAPSSDAKPGKVWNEERSTKMREIKSKLKIRDNDEFGPHIEMWSKGRLDSLISLNENDADAFIEHMFSKYIRPIKESGHQSDAPAVSSQESDEEAPY